ncbi:MAG: hypothetical protein A3J69_00890 [Candidatus Levybacteria bacterium RIFCSPHIGHO2_02_FULL_42_12]|nr:MAG: hypothetical protein A3J69_00890 [Candidatus Levybacteria bacterium RIFCSPHIGHO2_02_FULL_42_12]OGH42659.1 MAG: hypothetical protein A3B53_02630 [Candidatus Levybacteria bacterium RIFCSPLOWO2_01_FULL_42_15]
MKIDIAHVAKLANLPLSPKEEKKFEKQLSDVLGYIQKLNEVDTENVEPTFQVTGLETIVRCDTTFPSLSQDEALSGSTSTYNGLFKVKAIFGNES